LEKSKTGENQRQEATAAREETDAKKRIMEIPLAWESRQELSKHLDLVQPARWKNQIGVVRSPVLTRENPGRKIWHVTAAKPNRAQLDGLKGEVKIDVGRGGNRTGGFGVRADERKSTTIRKTNSSCRCADRIRCWMPCAHARS
jgi:hypothetical protein